MALPSDWRKRFLDALAATANITAAAKLSGVSRRQVYKVRSEDSEFAADMQQAIDSKLDRIEERFAEISTDGEVHPMTVWVDGQQETKEYRKVNVTAGIFLLKRWRPEYRDHHTLHHEGGVPVQIVNNFEGNQDAETDA